MNNVFKSYKRFCKIPYIFGTLGGAVFNLLMYLQDIVLMIHTKFFKDMSNSLKVIANYDKIQNGGHVVHSILAKSVSMDSA